MVLQHAYRFAPNAAYIDTCADQLGFLFGRNPYNRSQVTGLGLAPTASHSSPSFGVGRHRRPVSRAAGRRRMGLSPARWPARDPCCTLKAGLCWVDDQSNYEVNEVAINWNAALVYALASFLGGWRPSADGLGRRWFRQRRRRQQRGVGRGRQCNGGESDGSHTDRPKAAVGAVRADRAPVAHCCLGSRGLALFGVRRRRR